MNIEKDGTPYDANGGLLVLKQIMIYYPKGIRSVGRPHEQLTSEQAIGLIHGRVIMTSNKKFTYFIIIYVSISWTFCSFC